MPRLLAVSAVPPWPLRGGFSLRAAHLLTSLAREWEITLLVPRGQTGDPAQGSEHMREVIPVSLPRPAAAWPSFRERSRAAAEVRAEVNPADHDAVLLGPGTEFLAWQVPGLPPAVADRVDCTTLENLRRLRRSLRALTRVPGSAAYERRLVRRVFHTTAAGEDDARMLRRLSGSGRVSVIPNGVAARENPRFDRQSAVPTVAFSGTLNYYANVDAITSFVRRDWPRIRSGVPDARLLIVGRTPAKRVAALARGPGIEVRAEVPDMLDALAEAWLTVAPMRTGTGVKNKVLESWAAGRPAVMSRFAANGLDPGSSAHALVATGGNLSRLVIELLGSLERCRTLGEEARRAAASGHRWDRSGALLSRLLTEAAQERLREP